MDNAESGFGDCIERAILFTAALCFPVLLLCLGILMIGAVIFTEEVADLASTSRRSRRPYARTIPWLISEDNASIAGSRGRVGP